MDLTVVPRLTLAFAHLLLCVFALQCVLSTDWKLLRSRISAAQLLQAHRRVVVLLAGLWFTGLILLGLETGFAPDEIAARPKLLGKLACVLLLTCNGVLLRRWCFPRLVTERPLGRAEAMLLMGCGAVSTTSWLMAAFFGIARPLNLGWSAAAVLGLYALALLLAIVVAASLHGRLRDGRRQRAEGGGASAAAAAPADGQPIVLDELRGAH